MTRTYRLDGPAQILVRPDGYIAYVATGDYESTLARSASAMAPAAAWR